ncbi:MAG: hypothetical protein J6W13_05195 [Salinivirgaceae bacterium]|nr:hypothetical protein [Salinivirgaceae bacterium]
MTTNIFKSAIAALALLVAFNSCKEEKTKFHIEVACDPEQGTITGGGEYEEGEKATLTAIANPGYYFARWVGDYKSEDSVLTITVTANKSLSAIFGKIESSEYGSVKITISEGGTYYLYEAIPNENCYFVKWSDGSYELSKKVDVSAGENLTATFKPYPEGSIHALFFVSPTKRVIFSKGYLQFNPSLGTHTRADGTTAPGTWRFAENQTNMINSDLNVSATYDGWIDDFAWGTSGWSGSGATYYRPYDGYNSDDISEIPDSVGKLYGPQGEYDLTGDYAYADWGVYNPISNGGDKPGMWRTLTRDEFKSFLCTYYIEKYFRCLNGFVFYSGDYPLKDNEVINTPNDLSKYNNLLYFETLKEHWIANYSDEFSAKAVGISDMLNSNMGWSYKRFSRLPVRLVMDVEE